MPTLKKGQSKESYVSECIAQLIKEGYDRRQATAICFNKYKTQKVGEYLKKK